jgi:hypothetical protein
MRRTVSQFDNWHARMNFSTLIYIIEPKCTARKRGLRCACNARARAYNYLAGGVARGTDGRGFRVDPSTRNFFRL